MFKHILIPTDGTELSAKAVRAGVALAGEIGAKVTAFHAEDPVPVHIYGEGYLPDKELVAEFELRARQHSERVLAAVEKAGKAAGVPVETVVVKSPVAYRSIIDAARKKRCDAIFMASHGRRGLTGLMLGSVTQQVLSHSKIPVLVFR
jgi:nucleotide-binding universal stress UspA family protein